LTGFFSQGLLNFYDAPYKGTFKHRVVGASIGFWLSKKVILTNDQDKDGVIDKADGCPTVPGSAKAGGCPDKDDDGVADAVDKCPDVPGPARFAGCPVPDRDNDTVIDEEDQCPDVPGLINTTDARRPIQMAMASTMKMIFVRINRVRQTLMVAQYPTAMAMASTTKKINAPQ
jgi:hypothetical protein